MERLLDQGFIDQITRKRTEFYLVLAENQFWDLKSVKEMLKNLTFATFLS
jgi:hypothetical protein